MSKQMKGAYILMESLLKENVDTIFGYPGGSIMPTFDALYDYMDKFNYILTRHEQGATHAAQGYARVSGKTGVCLVTSGPGATNAITGIADAMMDSTPLVVIAGQAGAAFLGTDAFQEVDLIGITNPITKWNYQIRSAADIAPAVAKAFHIANSGRKGPVVLDFAKNAQVELADFVYEKCHFTRGYIPYRAVIPAQIDAAAEIINNAKKPLALVGQGVVLGNAESELKAFLEKADIPAGNTLLGLSALPSDHPLNKGMLGMHGNIGPNIKTNEADVIIAIGMRFDDRVTGDLKTYAKQAKIVHLDIDTAELDKNVKATAKVVGDVKATLPELTLKINEAKHSEWIESFREYELKEEQKVIRPEIGTKEGPLKMGEVVRKISEATNNEAVLVTDVGQNQIMAARYFKYTKSRSVVTSGGLGTMGFGIPAAIGAKIAAPERTVCMFAGDGGFQMTIQELGTIMEKQIGVKMIILNNNYLGMVRQWQELFYDARYSSTPMQNPDFKAISAAYGIKCSEATTREELDNSVKEMFADDKPYLLIANCEEMGMVYPMVPAGETVTNILLG